VDVGSYLLLTSPFLPEVSFSPLGRVCCLPFPLFEPPVRIAIFCSHSDGLFLRLYLSSRRDFLLGGSLRFCRVARWPFCWGVLPHRKYSLRSPETCCFPLLFKEVLPFPRSMGPLEVNRVFFFCPPGTRFHLFFATSPLSRQPQSFLVPFIRPLFVSLPR